MVSSSIFEKKEKSIKGSAGLLMTLFWFLIFMAGKHPDAPWGDGIGYALAIRNGYDFATNANSHFLYLNLAEVFVKILGIQDTAAFLGFFSAFWAAVSLYITYEIGKLVAGQKAGWISLNLLASSFAFWRLASIPEVYSMELAFFATCLFLLLRWSNSSERIYFHGFLLVHALGILVHIHLIVLFPLIGALFILSKKTPPLSALIWYLIPFLTCLWSVEFLGLNSWSQVFFDSAGTGLLSFQMLRLIQGPFFVIVLLIFMMPAFPLLVFLAGKQRIMQLKSTPFFWPAVFLLASFCGFAALYPDPGIFVFLLPAFLVLALFAGILHAETTQIKKLLTLIPVFQLACYVSGWQAFHHFAPESYLQQQEIKGGSGFIFLPWARENVASVLEKSQSIPPDSVPVGMRWNSAQALRYDSIRLLDKQAAGESGR
jgi:hypothetical protein